MADSESTPDQGGTGVVGELDDDLTYTNTLE